MCNFISDFYKKWELFPYMIYCDYIFDISDILFVYDDK